MPIIESLLDIDFYTLTMAQLLFHSHANITGTYKYKCRSKHSNGIPDGADPKRFLAFFREELQHYGSLSFSEAELSALKATGRFQDSFLMYLKHFKPNPDNVDLSYTPDEGLQMKITGSILDNIWFEQPLLAINSELYSRSHVDPLFEKGFTMANERLSDKIDYLSHHAPAGFNFADFGSRRRYCALFHDRVIDRMLHELPDGMLTGTSNCMLAMKYGIPMIGTMAHQLFQIYQALVGPERSVQATLEAWLKEYHGDLGIALSDIFGFEHFLKQFGWHYAHKYAGCRHDSGDPYWWAEKLLAHYKKHNIDATTKTAVFSDGLDFRKAVYLYLAFADKINVTFGIGTHLTNDTGLIDPLQIVIKLVRVLGKPVAKLADDSGKGMCEDPHYVRYVQHVCNL